MRSTFTLGHISGIKVGSVVRQELDTVTFMARVTLSIDDADARFEDEECYSVPGVNCLKFDVTLEGVLLGEMRK